MPLVRLSQLERQYARLKSLIYDRREKLEELVVLTEFRRFLDELERWIREKEIIASNEDTGKYFTIITSSYYYVIQATS